MGLRQSFWAAIERIMVRYEEPQTPRPVPTAVMMNDGHKGPRAGWEDLYHWLCN